MPREPQIPRCNFCGRPRNEVKHLIGAPDGANICNGCITVTSATIADVERKAPGPGTKVSGPLKKPREITAFVDEHVIGQDAAKREIAIAVYEHYRRREVDKSKNGVIMLDGEAVEIEKSNILLLGPSGCHRKGQLILMWDGTLQKVEKIRKGDRLMGPDSTPRLVQELHSGVQSMFQVTPVKGEPWVVNQGHILTLIRTSRKSHGQYRKVAELVDVSVEDWLSWSKTQKAAHKLLRVGVTFRANTQALPLEPYFLGVLLGDGAITSTPRVTTVDPEILAELFRQAERYGLKVVLCKQKAKCPSYNICGTKGGKPKENPITGKLRSLGLAGKSCGFKFIPQIYRTASEDDRLQLLAGLLDTDGHLGCNGFDFISKARLLAEGVAFIARSLGLAAYLRLSKKRSQRGTEGTYYRVSISGDTDRIPTRIPRKVATRRKQTKSVLHTGFTVAALPPEKFYGFSVNRDHRYLLGDFTVTHNSGKTHIARTIARLLDVPFYVGDATKLTSAGYVGEDVESLLQGLLADAQNDIEKAQWGIIFLDEFDKLARKAGYGASGMRDVTGEGVQQALLKLIEGGQVAVPRGMGSRAVSGMTPSDVVDTRNILFICAGSFAGIEPVIERRLNKSTGLGFGKEHRKQHAKSDLYREVTVEDIEEFGLIPEIVGRLPVITSTLELTEDELIRILTEPKNAICKQFRALFSLDGIDLQFDPEALRAVAQKARKRSTGARALRAILKEVLKPYSYEAPDNLDIAVIRITQEAVETPGKALVMRKGVGTA